MTDERGGGVLSSWVEGEGRGKRSEGETKGGEREDG